MNDVLDAAVFLLLTGAAVGTLAIPVHEPRAGSADDTATVVTTATATVNYSLAIPGGQAPSHEDGRLIRTANGTLAQLLAAAARRGVVVDGREVTTAGDSFEQAVITATTNATRGDRAVAVDAIWVPYPGAPVRGHVHAGPHPPPTTDVWSVSLTVGSGMPAVRDRAARAARSDGFAGVARAVAGAVVVGVFPPRKMGVDLRADPPTDDAARHRYRRFATSVDAEVGPLGGAADSRRANERIRRALATRLERDLRAAFETPDAAASAVSTGTVRVTVRRWDR